MHEAGVPSPFLGCACLGQASEWHRWEYYNGFAGRKKAVCSGKLLGSVLLYRPGPGVMDRSSDGPPAFLRADMVKLALAGLWGT